MGSVEVSAAGAEDALGGRSGGASGLRGGAGAPGVRAFVFYSVHERLFRPLLERLVARGMLGAVRGFCWGVDQADVLLEGPAAPSSLTILTRDVLPVVPAQADLEYLRERERRYGVSMHRMMWGDRHFPRARSYGELLALTQALLSRAEQDLNPSSVDCVVSENVSCLTSYLYWVVARARGIPFFCLAESRLPEVPMTIYRDGLQDFGFALTRFEQAKAQGLPPAEREAAVAAIAQFRDRPRQPQGMETKGRRPPGANSGELERLLTGARRYARDPRNQTLLPPQEMLLQRATRLLRHDASRLLRVFESPAPGEPFVLYPLHFQPEASTLILGPYYLNQLALIEDICKSLPVGVRLYVKEHSSSQGRRPISFYRALRDTIGVRLIGPGADTWELIRTSMAIAVITGTMGWEGVLFQKPVVTFGRVFYNALSFVHKASEVPKDRWYELFQRALFDHRHDEDELVAFYAALRATSFPAEMHGPATVPRVLEAGNLDRLAAALEAVLVRELRGERRVDGT